MIYFYTLLRIDYFMCDGTGLYDQEREHVWLNASVV